MRNRKVGGSHSLDMPTKDLIWWKPKFNPKSNKDILFDYQGWQDNPCFNIKMDTIWKADILYAHWNLKSVGDEYFFCRKNTLCSVRVDLKGDTYLYIFVISGQSFPGEECNCQKILSIAVSEKCRYLSLMSSDHFIPKRRIFSFIWFPRGH